MKDIVIIELDRPRELRFGFKALKMATEMLKQPVIDVVKNLKHNLNMNDDIMKLMYCGLLYDDKDIKLEGLEDMLDKAPYHEIMTKLMEAITLAYGFTESKEGPKEDKKK